MPADAALAALIHVVDFASPQAAGTLVLHVDSLQQSALAYGTLRS